MDRAISRAGALIAVAGLALAANAAQANPFSLFERSEAPRAYAYAPEQSHPLAAYAPQRPVPEAAIPGEHPLPDHLRRQVVAYRTSEPAGTIIVDTPRTYLYYVLGGGRAIRYGIGVGREGFTWAGVNVVSRMAEWPDWVPPADMLQRQPYLPRFMAGGPGNPLGARALYIGNTAYRIHGTNDPSSIGQRVSSGCIRMLNEDVIDLYSRARVGAKVVVLPAEPNLPTAAAAFAPTPRTQEAATTGTVRGLY